MGEWERPESVPIPTVWRRFEGKKPLGKNGKIPKFKVQDLTEDLKEAVINQMATYYLNGEPISTNLGLGADPVAVEDFKKEWNHAMDQKMVLVCLLENKDELEDELLPILAGCNLTHYVTPDYEWSPMRSKLAKPFVRVIDDCLRAINVYEKYNMDGYMHAVGLSVDPIYRGQGVGLEIIKARFDLGKAVGIKLTVTLFTAIESQKIAEKAGFETIYERDYSTYKDEQGNDMFIGIKSASVKLMAARIE